MRRTAIALLVITLLACPAFAGDADVTELAKGVKRYPTKFRLIAMGRKALMPLMAQVASDDKWLAFESASAVRWIAHHALRDGGAQAIAADLAEVLPLGTSYLPAQRALAAELLGDLGAAEHVDTLWTTYTASDVEGAVAEAAVNALARIPGEGVTKRLAEIASNASGAQQSALFRVLGDRRDPAALPLLWRHAGGGNRAAIDAIGASGVAHGEELLRGLCAKEVDGAFEALVHLGRAQRDTAMLARAYEFHAHDDARRLQVIRAVVDVPVPEGAMLAILSKAMSRSRLRSAAQHALLTCVRMLDGAGAAAVYAKVLAESDEEAITLRALSGLGRTGDAGSITLIEPFLAAEKPSIRTTAIRALGRLRGAEATSRLAGLLETCTDAADQSLVLRLLEQRADATAMPAVSAFMLAHKNEMRKEAGEVLIVLADKGSVDEARRVHHQLLDAGVQVAALRGLARTGDASSIDKIAPFAGAASGELTSLAGAALVAIGDRLAKTDKPNAIKAYRAALECGALVENKLRLLGEAIEITARGGRVSAWWVAGPFRAPDTAAWEKQEIDPKAVDLKAKGRWRPIQVGGENAIVDLDSMLSPNDGVVAYAFAEIWVKKARRVILKAGSDDGIRVWVNGQQVHTAFEPRGITVDGDVFDAQLKEGRNELLVKCCEIGGGWGFCLRLETEKGRPLKFKIR